MEALDNPTIHGVIFDLDGTLLDTEELSTQSLQKCVGKFNKVFTWELKQKILGLPKGGWSPIVIKELGLEGLLSPEDLAEEWEDNFRDMRARLRKCDGAEMVTRRLKELGIPQSIATSSSKGALVIKRQNHEELFQRMEYIVTGDDPKVIKGKPAPDIYLAAASRMGLDPKNCLAFEDALTGVQSAKSAGMFVIAVPDSRLDKKPFWEAGADLVLKSLSEWDPAAFRLEIKNGH